jgi:hypothetical protein
MPHLSEASDDEDEKMEDNSDTETELTSVEPIRLTLAGLRETYTRLTPKGNSPPQRLIRTTYKADIAKLSSRKRPGTLSLLFTELDVEDLRTTFLHRTYSTDSTALLFNHAM